MEPVRTPGAGRLGILAAFTATATLALFLIAPASAQVPFADAAFSGYATGVVFHADALQSGNTRAADVEVAFSGASVDSEGLDTRIVNEMSRVVQPAEAAKIAYARGTGLEIGAGIAPDGNNQVILAGKAETFAPPTGEPVVETLGPLPAAPVAWAEALRGRAFAHDLQGECVLGDDLSRGLGYAADVQLVDQGADAETEHLDQPLAALDAPDPERAVSQSLSRMRLVPQVGKDGTRLGDNFGVMSEVRQTIAPLTLFKNTDNEVTIEFLGEWVLRAVATGTAGGAYIHYGPGKASPETPILRTIDSEGTVTNVVTFQQLTGQSGLVIPVAPVAEIVIGEDPRAIGGNATSTPALAGDGTSAAAAVDVARVKLLEQADATGNVTARAAQFRVGHMEVRAQAPAGGIACSLPVTKTADPANVSVDEPFTTTITITNPFDCDLVDVRVTDEITAVQGARFAIDSVDPTANFPSGDGLRSATVEWAGLGPIPPDGTLGVSVTLTAQGGSGRIDDIATATGTLANCRGEDTSLTGVGLASAGAAITGTSAELQVPVAQVLGAQLARTGPEDALPTVATGLALLAMAVLGLTLGRRAF